MKYTVRKLFLSYEKEEKWINSMAIKGMALTNMSAGKYVFEKCTPGEYVYRIELLNYRTTHPESIAYINFIEETGVEHIASIMRWVYLRKKTSEGAFDLYSDLDCKIKYFQRIHAFYYSLMLLEFLIGVGNLIIGIVNVNNDGVVNGILGNINLYCSAFLFTLTLLIYLLTKPIRKKIKTLKKENMIRE
jgi:hypothetical protein